MKVYFVIVFILLLNFNVNAQANDNKVRHFEIDVLANFWTPTSTHLKATNSVMQIHIDEYYAQTGGISGYGTSVAPKVNLTYYFKNNVGMSLGFYPLIMQNELNVKETDTTFVSYTNQSTIINFTLGFAGQTASTSKINFYYGFGINFIPSYDFEMKVHTESVNPKDLEASDIALGGYIKSGIKIKLNNFISFKTGIDYSFVPRELEYNNGDGVVMYEKTNLGGIGLNTGFSFSF
jgi:outer membrane protein W